MQLTHKFQIYPTLEQEEILLYLSERCRLLYNFALSERIEAFKNNTKIDYYKQQNNLPSLKKLYPEYSYVFARVLQYTLRTLDANYKSFFALQKKGDTTVKLPNFKGNKYFTTMTYNFNGFFIKNNSITLSQFYKKEIPLSFTIPILKKYNKVYQVSIFKDSNNYFLSIVYESLTKPFIDNNLYQAIDLGITKTISAINTKGKFFEVKNSRPDKYWNPILDSLQSHHDHCKKYSLRWNVLNNSLKQCRKKLHNQIKNNQHKLSKKIINNTKSNTIIIGDLNVKQMSQSKTKSSNSKLNRSTQNTGYLSQFIGFLTYKAQLNGKKIIKIDESYTSKKCYVCGKLHNMPLSKRIMKCDCGNSIDRDRNSSINIMLRFLSQNALWQSYQQFVDNLRNTGLLVPLNIRSSLAEIL